MKKVMVTTALLLVAGTMVAMETPVAVTPESAVQPVVVVPTVSVKPIESQLMVQPVESQAVVLPLGWKRKTVAGVVTPAVAAVGAYAGYTVASRFTDKPGLRFAGAAACALPLGYAALKLALLRKRLVTLKP